MSKTKFTPGPWVAENSSVVGPDDRIIAAFVMGFVDRGCPEEDHATATLVAAAPDMYAAMEDMLSGWRYIRQVHGDLPGVGWDRAEQKAVAALAKARGES